MEPFGDVLGRRVTESGRVLWFGWGDLAKKMAPVITEMRQVGYEIWALDITDKPEGLKTVEPDHLLNRTSLTDHNKLREVGRKHGFDLAYIGNMAHQHIGSAIEVQHWARNIILAKPLDTSLGFLRAMRRDQHHYTHFLQQLGVHDHYTNKPGITYLQRLMASSMRSTT